MTAFALLAFALLLAALVLALCRAGGLADRLDERLLADRAARERHYAGCDAFAAEAAPSASHPPAGEERNGG